MTKQRVVNIVIIIAVILLGWFIWKTLKDDSDLKPVNNAKTELQAVSEKMIGLTMKVPGPNKDEYWILNCAMLTQAKIFATLSGINGQYYNHQKSTYYLTAQSGRIYWESSTLEFYGNVKLSANDGKKLSAKEISWNPKTNLVDAKDNVYLTTSSFVVNTDRIVTNFELKKVAFKGLTKVFFKDLRGE